MDGMNDITGADAIGHAWRVSGCARTRASGGAVLSGATALASLRLESCPFSRIARA
jgi:hypothetical protein